MTVSRNIKVWFCMACLASSMAAPAQQLTLDIIDMAAISRMTPQQLEKLAEGLAAEEIMRTKRSSAQDVLTSVVSKASSGLQSKVGLLGQASAFISSASSKTSHDDHPGYSYEPHDSKVDFLGLKKSILYTLFQAVKAITGGVTILKGQLIKGGGALAATLGKVISVKGDAVSNFGKKIVSSAALSHKPQATAVYGPPPAHVEYAPAEYGAPTASAHFSHSAPSAPATGYAAHKYPSSLDGHAVYHQTPVYFRRIGHAAAYHNYNTPEYFRRIGRGKLNGVHAGLVILTPLGDTGPAETHLPPHSGHTPLEPPQSIIHNVYSAIKGAFAPPTAIAEEHGVYQPPPPPPVPSFKPMAWGAVNSYGEPASVDAYTDYDPRNPYPPYASAKHSRAQVKKQGLTQDKMQKIQFNLNKLTRYMNGEIQRSSEDMPKFTGLNTYSEMLKKGQVPLMPTSVVTDNEIGVLPADLLPNDPVMTTTSTTTTEQPTQDKTENEQIREKKDLKYFLRGNRIVVQG